MFFLRGGTLLRIFALVSISCLLIPLSAAAQSLVAAPWMDRTLSPDARADLVQAEMSQAEELLLLKGYYGSNAQIPWTKSAPIDVRPLLPGTAGYVPGIDRLGIPALGETDAGVGIANTNLMRPGDRATAFPSGLS